MITAAEPFAIGDDDAEAQLALLGVTLEQVLGELDYRRQRKMAQALEVQRRAAKLQGERKFIEGGDVGGEVQFQMHPFFYHAWGQREGYDCWDDKNFVREMLRDNPECRVRSTSATPRVGYGTKAANLAPNTGRGVRGRRGRWAL